jgi:hypothetical protein
LALQDKAKTFKTALLTLVAENIALIVALMLDWGLSR